MWAVITMPGVVGVTFFGIATYALIVASGRVSVMCCVVMAGSVSGTIGGWGCPKSVDCAVAGAACAAAIAATDPPINLLRSIVVMGNLLFTRSGELWQSAPNGLTCVSRTASLSCVPAPLPLPLLRWYSVSTERH